MSRQADIDTPGARRCTRCDSPRITEQRSLQRDGASTVAKLELVCSACRARLEIFSGTIIEMNTFLRRRRSNKRRLSR